MSAACTLVSQQASRDRSVGLGAGAVVSGLQAR